MNYVKINVCILETVADKILDNFRGAWKIMKFVWRCSICAPHVTAQRQHHIRVLPQYAVTVTH
jgi:hypothetical protein